MTAPKQAIIDAHLPPTSDGWRIVIHDQLKPVLKPLFEVARKETPDRCSAEFDHRRTDCTRPESVAAYVRLYRGTSKFNRKLQREEIDVGPPLYGFIGDFRTVFGALTEPEGTPRRGFTVRVEVFKGWGRWVVYVREVPR